MCAPAAYPDLQLIPGALKQDKGTHKPCVPQPQRAQRLAPGAALCTPRRAHRQALWKRRRATPQRKRGQASTCSRGAEGYEHGAIPGMRRGQPGNNRCECARTHTHSWNEARPSRKPPRETSRE